MSNEAQLTAALEEAWAELERKQTYIQNAFDSAGQLQQELDDLKASSQAAASLAVSAGGAQPLVADADPALQSALESAWLELEKKQQFLENIFEELRLRDVELAALRQQVADVTETNAQTGNLVQPDVQKALEQAWNDLEARDLQILDLNARLEALDGRVEWLLLENKTLSSAIGVDKIRQ